MSTNFEALMASPGRRRAEQVAYSVHMLSDIAVNYDKTVDSGEFTHARCMIDAFYVHLRLLADFLVKETSGLDFGPSDFGIEWTKPNTEEALRLADYWKQASKYVVHFGRPRVPEDLDDLAAFEVNGPALRAMTGDALAVVRRFVAILEADAAAWTGGALIPDPAADPAGWQLRVHADQAGVLRSALDATQQCLER